MDEQMSKEKLLKTLRARRAEWDAALAEVPAERMSEPGVAGEWSVKDVVSHITYYERWFADRLDEVLRGESYAGDELDMMGEARNDIVYERTKDLPVAEVMADSRQSFQRLIAGVEAHSEEFLTQPQQFEGAPEPVLIWEMLRGDVYEHYGPHIEMIRGWLASGGA